MKKALFPFFSFMHFYISICRDYYAMWLLEKKRDWLIADKERTETELKRISSELESVKNKIAENNLLIEN